MLRRSTAWAVIVLGASIASEAAAQRGTAADYPPSLAGVWVPDPTRITDFVADREAAIRLGKAWFWDVALGSDNQVACATCHGLAGVDPRTANVVHPGANGGFDGGVGPGEALLPLFFPTTVYEDPRSSESMLLRNVDDVVGSEGVLKRFYIGLGGEHVELCEDVPDPVFNQDGVDVRQVSRRNAPTTVNAAFNIRQFWDGRASPWFNGVDILGPTNPDAFVWEWDGRSGSFVRRTVMIDFAGLASQAMGPPQATAEMSCSGRSWPDIAAKLIDAQPLAGQQVSPDDSVLGVLASASGPGLDTTYRQMIDAAFHERWRRSETTPDGLPQVEANFTLIFGLAMQEYERTLVSDDAPYDRFAAAGFPQGGGGHLTPRQLEGLDVFSNEGQWSDIGVGRCIHCHSGPVFSQPTWPRAGGRMSPPSAGTVPRPVGRGLELMVSADLIDATRTIVFADHAVEDGAEAMPLNFELDDILEILYLGPAGIENDHEESLIVTTFDLPGLDECDTEVTQEAALEFGEMSGEVRVLTSRTRLETGACGSSVSISLTGLEPGEYGIRVHNDLLARIEVPHTLYDEGFYFIGVRPPYEDVGLGGIGPSGVPLSWTRRVMGGHATPEIDATVENSFGDPIVIDGSEVTAVDGAFKTPTLRNIALTGPYMHNGGQATLRQVMEFYARGGDWSRQHLDVLTPEMRPLDLTEDELEAVVAFMEALTDDRVANASAPFDHPQLPLPSGGFLPAVGAAGRSAECLLPHRSFEARLLDEPMEEDCNGDGLEDACQIARDPMLDADGNGILDACESPACPADLDGNGIVDGADFGIMLGAWGPCEGAECPADFDADGVVGGSDLGIMLGAWGVCEG